MDTLNFDWCNCGNLGKEREAMKNDGKKSKNYKSLVVLQC